MPSTLTTPREGLEGSGGLSMSTWGARGVQAPQKSRPKSGFILVRRLNRPELVAAGSIGGVRIGDGTRGPRRLRCASVPVVVQDVWPREQGDSIWLGGTVLASARAGLKTLAECSVLMALSPMGSN